MDTTPTSVRNRLWITRYARAIALLGVLVLIGGVVYGAIAAFELYAKESRPSGWVVAGAFVGAAALSLTGFLLLGLANLLTYILGARQQPGWILERAEKGLYLLAACRLLGYAFVTCYVAKTSPVPWSNFRVGFAGMSAVTGAIVLVALGLVLRRSLPIIEESRTLV